MLLYMIHLHDGDSRDSLDSPTAISLLRKDRA